MFGYCATGGGYHGGGGVFGPLGTMVPWGDSPREGTAAHGPFHPAVWIPLGSCCGLCRVVVLALQVFVCLFVKPLLFLRGRCLFWSFKPFTSKFTTRPVFGFYLPVFFFFSCLVFSSTPCSLFLSLSLSLSGAGETQTFLVWVSPCVLFFLHADYDYDPYFFLITYTQATPSPCFFFSSSPSLVFRFGCFSVLVLVVLGVFVGANCFWGLRRLTPLLLHCVPGDRVWNSCPARWFVEYLAGLFTPPPPPSSRMP